MAGHVQDMCTLIRRKKSSKYPNNLPNLDYYQSSNFFHLFKAFVPIGIYTSLYGVIFYFALTAQDLVLPLPGVVVKLFKLLILLLLLLLLLPHQQTDNVAREQRRQTIPQKCSGQEGDLTLKQVDSYLE